MRVEYNTLPPCNPLFTLQTSRFVMYPAATSEPATSHNKAGLRDLNSPIHPDPCCHPLDLRFACHLPAGKGYLSPKALRREPLNLSNPLTPGWAAA